MTKIAGICLLFSLLPGCAPVLIASAYYDHTKNREERAAFVKDYNAQNLERMKANIQPLVWCDELYRFDKNWYASDKTCVKS